MRIQDSQDALPKKGMQENKPAAGDDGSPLPVVVMTPTRKI